MGRAAPRRRRRTQAERDKFSVYFNLDNGYPPITGFYMEGNEPARAIIGGLAEAARRHRRGYRDEREGIGATDHLSFTAVGVPGFQAVQNYVNYDVRTHHTNMDAAERDGAGRVEAGGGGDGDGALSGGDEGPEDPAAVGRSAAQACGRRGGIWDAEAVTLSPEDRDALAVPPACSTSQGWRSGSRD